MTALERFSVAGRTAIVTGASSGLGVTFAHALAEGGANVVLAARRVDKLEEVKRQLQRFEGEVMVQPCDVSDSASVAEMARAAWERFGRVDILLNNAGTAAEAGIMPERTTDDLFMATINTNLAGLFWCCREVGARQLADGKGGSIINVASIMGLAGAHNIPVAYQASKAGVINLTRNLAASWADRGVRVNAIAPGWFPSEMTNDWFAVPEFLQRVVDAAPMARLGDPEELTGALLFLASDASSFVTGQTIAVDGGLSATSGASSWSDALFTVVEGLMGEGGTRILPNAK
jgi:NAD(P)-dependent dehydrogenase (short-subunit alcohol dehydrogenase family)